jgi:hypothetical protein
MRQRILALLFVGLAAAVSGGRGAFPHPNPPQKDAQEATPEAGGEDLRIETEHGPIHLWRPGKYDPRTAGIVVYIHGYYTSLDQTWTDDHLATQFGDSGRNALFIAIKSPQSNTEDVSWKSLEDLLRTVEDRTPFSLPHGSLVVVGHSAGYRTILLWLGDPRVQFVILLDGLYAGQAEFRSWLLAPLRAGPHRMALVSIDTWRQSNRLARRVPGTARRRSVPAKPSSFTPREIHSRLIYLRSQYNHNQIISSGKVIPVLLQIAPLKGLATGRGQGGV